MKLIELTIQDRKFFIPLRAHKFNGMTVSAKTMREVAKLGRTIETVRGSVKKGEYGLVQAHNPFNRLQPLFSILKADADGYRNGSFITEALKLDGKPLKVVRHQYRNLKVIDYAE